MADKYREFWISIERGHKYWSEYPIDKSDTNECVHLIEYAAYEESESEHNETLLKCASLAMDKNKLQKQNQLMREALEEINSHQNCRVSFEIAKQTLEKLNGMA